MGQGCKNETQENLFPKYYNRLFLGEGLFETMAVKDGRIMHADLHWQRMNDSANALAIPFHLSLTDWLTQLSSVIKQENCQNGVIKAILIPITEKRGLSVSVDTSEIIWQVFESEVSQGPVTLISLPWHRDSNNPLYRHKTLSYLENIQAKHYALSKGRDDVLVFDQHGYLLEASSANIFLVIGGTLYTPSLNLSILPGIMRQLIIDKAKIRGLLCIEENLTQDHLCQADSLFLTNSLMGLLPVQKFDEQDYAIDHIVYQLLKR